MSYTEYLYNGETYRAIDLRSVIEILERQVDPFGNPYYTHFEFRTRESYLELLAEGTIMKRPQPDKGNCPSIIGLGERE